ncbi:hypothetical protein [Haloferax sp. DFSO52]|uniref:hypothetical protein n=1 Tax=Haloferax sp. DFSO52 TaxID=3388505 RepID=UPI003A8C50BA
MDKQREPLEQAKVVIGSGLASWESFSKDERYSTFDTGLRNLDKVDWVPPEYQSHLEEAKQQLRNGSVETLAEYERKSALRIALGELKKIEWEPPSDEKSV